MSLVEGFENHFNKLIESKMVSEKDTFFILSTSDEFHYCPPGVNDFTCKFGEAVVKRDALPEGFTLSKWKIDAVNNEEEMLSAYDQFMSTREQ